MAPGAHAEEASAVGLTYERRRPEETVLYGASVTSRIATGRRAGQPGIRVGDCIDPDVEGEFDGERCAARAV